MHHPSRLFALALATSAVLAQAEPEQGSPVPIAIDSGYVALPAQAANLGVPQPVWSTVVSVPATAWLRLRYAGVLLSGAARPGADGSYLRLTSLRDGAVQTQHLEHIAQWQETSAYFNGDAVLVELWAFPGTGDNRLQIDQVIAGPDQPLMPDSICGSVDDRTLSSDPRAARNQPTGCTSWLIDDCNHCFLTAGHCAAGVSVVQFNVPLSTSSGALQHPGPQDQYAVDQSSKQSNGGQGVGNDWAYFGVFPNSTTGLTPYAANGNQSYALLAAPPAAAGQPIRVTGYGSTTAPVSPTWYLVQKTHVGPNVAVLNTTIQYATDTTGGNSGSPVFLDGTNQAIGIHTHAGCTSTGGANQGTASNHPGLQAALANPLGVCDCPGLEFTFPNGLPASVAPNGSSTIRVQIGGAVSLLGGSVRFHWSTGGPFTVTTPTAVGPNLFDAAVPAVACGNLLQFYFSAQDIAAITYTSPEQAPSSVHSAIAIDSLTTIRQHDFNTTPPNWNVVNTALTSGAWVRGTPIDSRGPQADFDGSGQCWVTGNVNNEDVDGGPTTLTTEVVNLTGSTDPRITFAVWFTNDDNDDRLRVDLSNDGGANWTNVLNLGPFSGWAPQAVRVRDFFATPGQVALRFVTSDNPNNSVTEAALDAYRIADFVCTPASFVTYGAGCSAGGSAPVLVAQNLPQLGTTFVLGVQGLGSGLRVMLVGDTAVNTPLPLPEFAANCTLLATPQVAELLANGGTSATWSLTIPPTPSLAGVRLYAQAFELGSPWTLSQGGQLELR